jgi:predicted Fe-Mo cluster-binding NifX family protein
VKIAAVTDDGKTISMHFGRARYYSVITVEDGKVVSQEMREKAGHHNLAHTHSHDHDHDHDHDHEHEHGHEHGNGHGHNEQGHGFGKGAADRHAQMIAAITDCEAVLVRGMGRGAYLAIEQAKITPIVTDIATIDDAVQAYLNGDIIDHTERLH